MDSSAQAWRMKIAHSKTKLGKKNQKNKSSKPSTKSKKSKSGSVASVCTDASANCCACIGAIAEYMKEILKCLCKGGNMTETRFGEILCELLTHTGDLCSDCLNFVKCILGKLCDLKKIIV